MKVDPLNKELITLLARRPAPPNSWAQQWIDVQLGAAYAAAGESRQAAAAFERALVIQGDFDHPLTGTALFELGQLALQSGDLPTAARMLEETTYAAATFPDPGLMEEAFRNAGLTHFLAGGKDCSRGLVPATAWAQQHGLRQLQTSLLTTRPRISPTLATPTRPRDHHRRNEADRPAGHGHRRARRG